MQRTYDFWAKTDQHPSVVWNTYIWNHFLSERLLKCGVIPSLSHEGLIFSPLWQRQTSWQHCKWVEIQSTIAWVKYCLSDFLSSVFLWKFSFWLKHHFSDTLHRYSTVRMLLIWFPKSQKPACFREEDSIDRSFKYFKILNCIWLLDVGFFFWQ